MRKKLRTLGTIVGAIAFTAATALSGCATFKPVNTTEGLVDGYPASITELDRNDDKKYDMIVYKVGSRLMVNFCFVDEDFNETLDLVVRGVFDAEGNLDLNRTYEGRVNYEDFFEEVMGRKPTEEEKKPDVFYEVLLKEID